MDYEVLRIPLDTEGMDVRYVFPAWTKDDEVKIVILTSPPSEEQIDDLIRFNGLVRVSDEVVRGTVDAAIASARKLSLLTYLQSEMPNSVYQNFKHVITDDKDAGEALYESLMGSLSNAGATVSVG